MPILRNFKDRDYWLFGEIYSVLIAFADDPNNVISRIRGGRISILDDQANQLHQVYRSLVAQYPDATDLEVMKVASTIDTMLDARSAGGDLFDKTFWTNGGFIRHPDWATIRELAREFLVR